MTMLKILDDKRVVARRTKVGRAYVYEPLVTREEVCRSMAKELTRSLFRGSAKSLVLSLIETDALSRADIEELKRAIESLEANQ
jgi:predicted transcriptional regulator